MLYSWRQNHCGRRSSAVARGLTAARSPARFRPRLEALEERALLSAGDLDPTFGTGGQVQTDFPPNTTAAAAAVAVQPDGKILAGGSANVGSNFNIVLARYKPDGSLDPSFGTSGRVITHSAGGIAGIVLQPDGKIVTFGQGASPTAFRGSQVVVARYQSDGSIDSSFGTGGQATHDSAGGSWGALQPDGKIVVVGTDIGFNTGDVHGTVVRFNPDGSVDTGFGTGGVVRDFSAGGVFTTGFALQPDGKIVVGSTSSSRAITRLNVDGSLDRLFGNAGHAPAPGVRPDGLAVQPDGHILVIGDAVSGVMSVGFGVARLNADGTPDTTFGMGGSVITDLGPGTLFSFGVVLQPDGRLLIAGTVGFGTGQMLEMIRHNSDGSLDPTFGTGGKVTTKFGTMGTSIRSVALQPDGKIVTAGYVTSDPTNLQTTFTVARFLGTASANQRFVAQVYLDLLGRAPEPAGLNFWASLLDQGTGRIDVVRSIEGSQEYHTLVIQNLYRSYLGRPADPTGLAASSAFLSQGGTAEQLAAILLGSPEYFANHGSDNTAFLQALYRDTLQRPIDSTGQQGWSQALTGGMPRANVAALVLGSQESDMVEVQGLYRKFLRRAADNTGLTGFTALLQRGTANEEVLAQIVGSDEYFGRL
jgi:uncharacterized delta-60 repeat protein